MPVGLHSATLSTAAVAVVTDQPWKTNSLDYRMHRVEVCKHIAPMAQQFVHYLEMQQRKRAVRFWVHTNTRGRFRLFNDECQELSPVLVRNSLLFVRGGQNSRRVRLQPLPHARDDGLRCPAKRKMRSMGTGPEQELPTATRPTALRVGRFLRQPRRMPHCYCREEAQLQLSISTHSTRVWC